MVQRPSQIRRFLEDDGMSVDDAPADEGPGSSRQTHNFAPSYQGIVYRAHSGASEATRAVEDDIPDQCDTGSLPEEGQVRPSTTEASHISYSLQAMKWGIIPSWTKRSPAYSDIMKAINCRSDSLSQKGGMWASMKKRKRCLVIAQGFFEWLQKGPKEKIPHYIKRKDGHLMCFAGLWDAVKYQETDDPLYTYSIITTDANEQMKALHQRMPVILEQGSDKVRTWLDPDRTEWSSELQGLLKPFDGELEIYPVNREVGKVGRDSPTFVIPLNSKENKANIANFFASPPKKRAARELLRDESLLEQRTARKSTPSEEPPSKRAKTLLSSTKNPPRKPGGKESAHAGSAAAPRITDFFSRGT